MDVGINLLGEWRANEKEIIKNIHLLQSVINAKAVHDIRVAIKKLRAYCELINELDKSAETSLPLTKSLFDILGEHRECDTMLKYLRKSRGDKGELCPLLVAHIRRTKNEITLVIKNAAGEYNVSELEDAYKRLEELTKTRTLQQLADDSKSIIKRHISSLKKRSAFLKKETHNIRKLMKVILYWVNLFPPEYVYSKNQVKLLDDFLDKIGKWHDFQIVLGKIRNYRTHHLDKSLDEHQTIKKIEKDIKDSRDKLFNKLKPQAVVKGFKAEKF